jgi:TPR repeat protein
LRISWPRRRACAFCTLLQCRARPSGVSFDLAQLQLDNIYEHGSGVSFDLAEAARLYRMAAVQGSAAGRYNLGLFYSKGMGVPQDYAEAARLYRLAAAQGVASAQFNLALLYTDGKGVALDYAEAAQLFRLAAAQESGPCRRAVESRHSLLRGQGRGLKLCGGRAAVAAGGSTGLC